MHLTWKDGLRRRRPHTPDRVRSATAALPGVQVTGLFAVERGGGRRAGW